MGGCCGGSSERKFYMLTAAGVIKILAIVAGSVPVILGFLLYSHYTLHARPDSDPNIIIQKDARAVWELAYLIVVASTLVITLLNLLLYTFCKCLSKNIWTKRIDCTYFTMGGTAQATVGFIMLASALTSNEMEPVEMKYASAFLGIATGIIYWGAATLVNQD